MTDALHNLKRWDPEITTDRHGRVTGLAFLNKPATRTTLRYVEMLQHLRELSIPNAKVGDGDLSALHPPCLRNLTCLVLYNTRLSDEGLKSIAGLRKLETLDLARTSITDAGLKWLKSMRCLRFLCLGETPIRGKGLWHLRHATTLETLTLNATLITNQWLKHVLLFPSLTTLWIYDTQIDDDGVMQLAKLRQLQYLGLTGTGVTHRGAEQLRRALPHAEVNLGHDEAEVEGQLGDLKGSGVFTSSRRRAR